MGADYCDEPHQGTGNNLTGWRVSRWQHGAIPAPPTKELQTIGELKDKAKGLTNEAIGNTKQAVADHGSALDRAGKLQERKGEAQQTAGEIKGQLGDDI